MSATTAPTAAKPATPAAPKRDEVTLLIRGKSYGGWKEVRITRGLERACADFTLSVSERYPGATQEWRISPGDACEVRIGEDTVLTGWVDAFTPSIAATSHQVNIKGRSKTCDFVDSSVDVDGGQFNNQTLTEIAKQLAKPFGLEVVTQAAGSPVANASAGSGTSGTAASEEDEDEPIPDVQCQQTETCFQLVERLARLQELLITDDEKGRLVLCHPGDNKASTALVQGKNIVEGSADLDESKRFQKYVVKGQRAGNRTKDHAWAKKSGKSPFDGLDPSTPPTPAAPTADPATIAAVDAARAEWWAARRLPVLRSNPVDVVELDDGEDGEDDGEDDGPGTGGGHDAVSDRGAKVITQILATTTDADIKRYRVHVLIAETSADDMDAQQRADWEKRRRVARGLKANVTVLGWRQRDGRLWKTNEMVQITAPYLGLDKQLVVGQVEFGLGSDGQTTKLELTLPDAYLPDKIKKKKRKGKGKVKGKKKGGGGISFEGLGT